MKIMSYVVASIVGVILLPLVAIMVILLILQLLSGYGVKAISFILEKCFTGLAARIEILYKKLKAKI